ncbi:MAG TPA: nicotinate-nucleotide adenylyltransferase [Candidatus Dormibacteraeota bacterium]|jgi:nicotinate-nucleotide adenylyltransferase
MRLGVLGGTFDPVHLGHLGAAQAALECAGLDRVLFMPSAHPPHRAGAVADAEERLAMCRLAVVGAPQFEVSDIEIARGGRSYTVDTLAELRSREPDAEMFLILGWDAARLFHTWREPSRVRELASIIVVSRPGGETPEAGRLADAGLGGPGVVLCLRATPDISASRIRKAIAQGQPVQGMVPGSVASFIAGHGLYGDNR